MHESMSPYHSQWETFDFYLVTWPSKHLTGSRTTIFLHQKLALHENYASCSRSSPFAMKRLYVLSTPFTEASAWSTLLARYNGPSTFPLTHLKPIKTKQRDYKRQLSCGLPVSSIQIWSLEVTFSCKIEAVISSTVVARTDLIFRKRIPWKMERIRMEY